VANSIDQQFIEYIVKSLVSKPDEVKIERRIDEKGVLLELTVDPEDLGRVIGKRGATAQSLRTLLRALGTKNDARYNLKIVDTGRPEPSGGSSGYSRSSSRDDTDEPTNGNDDLAEGADEDATESHSSAIDRTRKELAELDDLDV
jgi:predicted RNA-binding protein YlqC (UPF0109 family)